MTRYSFTIVDYNGRERKGDISEDVYNNIINKLDKVNDYKFVQEWETNYYDSILRGRQYRNKSKVLILWKEVLV